MAERRKFTYEHGGDVMSAAERDRAPQPPSAPRLRQEKGAQTADVVSDILAQSARGEQVFGEHAAAASVTGAVLEGPAQRVERLEPKPQPAEKARLSAVDIPEEVLTKAPLDFGTGGAQQEELRAKPRAAAKKSARKSGATAKKEPSKSPKAKKSGKGALVAVACLLVVAVAFAALHLTGTFTLSDLAGLFSSPKITYFTYTVDSEEKLLRFLKHPALKSGDTLQLSGNYTVDVDDAFKGYAALPLINMTGGSVTFVGGTVVLSGDSDSVDMSGVSFNTQELFIEAPGTALKLGAADDANINVASLNGSPHAREIAVLLPGMIFSVPVTFTNVSATAQNNVTVNLTSPSFIFTQGNTVTIDSIGAGETVSKDIEVLATEAGRATVTAYACDASGGAVITGASDYISIHGPGFYAGDPHTHTTASDSQRFSTLDENVTAAFDRGLSYIFSVENRAEAEKLSQGEMDALTGAPGQFLQIIGGETSGDGDKHLLIYGTNERPSSDYRIDVYNDRTWLYQDAVDAVVNAGGFVVLPHYFRTTMDEGQIASSRSVRYATGIEILTLSFPLEDMATRLAYVVWDNHNVRGISKMFGVFSSNNIFAEQIGTRYIKSYLPILTEDNVTQSLRTGNYFMTTGPELRFTLGGAPMGGDLLMPKAAQREEQPQETQDGEAVYTPTPVATAKIYASDTSPLTSVKLLKFRISGNIDAIEPEVLYEENLTGKGLFEFYKEISVDMEPDTYYRVEIRSEKPRYYDDICGVAYSNPIYCYEDVTQSFSTITDIEAGKGLDILQSPNGTRYVIAGKDVGPNYFDAVTTGTTRYIEYHAQAGRFADYISITSVAENASYNEERIYVIYR